MANLILKAWYQIDELSPRPGGRRAAAISASLHAGHAEAAGNNRLG
jgi:hypothetical protein